MSIYSRTESRRSRKSEGKVEQQMAAMIDVVFLLLIFFVITVKPEDILAHLEVMRPAPEKVITVEDPPPLLEVEVFKNDYVISGRKVTLDGLEKSLEHVAKYSDTSGIIIKCSSKSNHARLIRVLNVCEKTGFKKISLLSI